MIDYYSVVKENGREYADKIAARLEKQGNEILGIEEAMVPRGEDINGKPILVPGYRITVDNGRPPLYREMQEEEARWLWDND